jgi:hypothetical protein
LKSKVVGHGIKSLLSQILLLLFQAAAILLFYIMQRIITTNTWTDHETNTEIAKELNTTPVLDKIQDYKREIGYNM